MDIFTREQLDQRVGRAFQARLDDRPDVELRLVEVTSPRSSGGWTTFSARFVGPGSSPLEQATYVLATGDIEGAEIFLVPVGRGPDGIEYEAVFTQQSTS